MAQEEMTGVAGAGVGGGRHPSTSLAPSLGFHPAEEEQLGMYYLWRKVSGKPFHSLELVNQIDIYKYEPWELSAMWYFFSQVDRKYGNGYRATQQGYWRSFGKDRLVRNMSQTIGMKKTLVFFSGQPPNGKMTDWVMYEYRLPVDKPLENAFVLCKISQNSALGLKALTIGKQHVPLLQEDLENDDSLHIPPGGGEADNDITNGVEPVTDFSRKELQDKQTALLFPKETLDPQSQSIDFLHKGREGSDDLEFLSLGLSKRSKLNDPSTSNDNRFEDSTTSSQGPSRKMTTDDSSTALDQHSKQKESQVSNLLGSSSLEISVPPGFLMFMNNLENDIHNGSTERESLKLQLRQAEETINTLQKRIEFLTIENEYLRGVVQGSGR